MLNFLAPIIISAALTVAISAVATLTAMKMKPNREKASPFECGFDPKNTARTPFSNRFFLIAVLFLIFDIEIVILLPLPLIAQWNTHIMLTATAILLILLLGTLHEMRQGALDWKDVF